MYTTTDRKNYENKQHLYAENVNLMNAKNTSRQVIYNFKTQIYTRISKLDLQTNRLVGPVVKRKILTWTKIRT